MTHGEPIPRQGVVVVRPPWPFELVRRVDFDTVKTNSAAAMFDDVLSARRSRRTIAASPTSAVGAVIRHALKTNGEGQSRKRKAAMSAGALHPVVCVFFRTGRDVMLYDDDIDCFGQIRVKDEILMAQLVARCMEVLPECDGHWVLLLADRELTARSYKNPESLIWRDAGVALQTLALVAEAHGLAFCPLGILGQEGVGALLGQGDRFVAVGMAGIGLVVD